MKTIEGFISELGCTVTECIDCGCLTPGGPTRCKRCARDWERKYRQRWHLFPLWRDYFHRRLIAKIKDKNGND